MGTMRGKRLADQKMSARAFADLVWPEIRSLCGGGDVRYVENSKHETDHNLDVLAGIDAYQILNGKSIRGIASRVQPSDQSWDSFTIRYERKSAAGFNTEYKKRLEAVRSRGELLTPYLCVQAYVSRDWSSLFSLAVVRVPDLFEFAERERETYVSGEFPRADAGGSKRGCYIQTTYDPSGPADFVVVPWALLSARGVRVERRPLEPHRRPPPQQSSEQPQVTIKLPSGGATAYPRSERWPAERATDMVGWIEEHASIYDSKTQPDRCADCGASDVPLHLYGLPGSSCRDYRRCAPCAEAIR